MAILFYRLFLWTYRYGVLLLSAYNNKAKRWLSGRKSIWADLQAFVDRNRRQVVWFHCASLGEFEQARPLLERLHYQYPGYAILLSFFSPSGYEIRKDYKEADFVTYLPLDGAVNAKNFLDLVQPALVIWVKYEYWHFYLHGIKQRNIPLLLVSGIFRPDQPFFQRWGGFYRNMLHCFSYLFVQNHASEKLLATIGFSGNVSVGGDTRFDRVTELASAAEKFPVVEKFIDGCPVIIAGSTWAEDEEALDHFANMHAAIRFIIAPHEIDEDHLRQIEKLFHHSIRYSNLVAGGRQITAATPIGNSQLTVPNTLIIDNIGMLAYLYQYATIAYVGGGFGNDGVHNVLEAAVYSRPVIFGPVHEKFPEAGELIDTGAAFCIENALELEETLLVLLKNTGDYAEACKAAGDYVTANRGATDKILRYIQEKRLLTN